MITTSDAMEYGKQLIDNQKKANLFTNDMIHLLLNIIFIPERKEDMIKKAITYLTKSGFIDEKGEPTELAVCLDSSPDFLYVK